MERPKFRRAFLHPRYWLMWIGFALFCLLAQLPYAVLLVLGRALGRLLYFVAKSRRHIIQRNLELCLPQLTAAQRSELLKKNFESTGIALSTTSLP